MRSPPRKQRSLRARTGNSGKCTISFLKARIASAANSFQELAKRLKLSSADLLVALEKRKFLAKVRADFAGGARGGVSGNPTFFLNGRRADRPFEYAEFV